MADESKLSKLQKFILLEALKELPKLEETARGLTAWASGMMKPGWEGIKPTDLAHITRNSILLNFFKLSLRKMRWGGRFAEKVFGTRVRDQDTNRIDAEAAGTGAV